MLAGCHNTADVCPTLTFIGGEPVDMKNSYRDYRAWTFAYSCDGIVTRVFEVTSGDVVMKADMAACIDENGGQIGVPTEGTYDFGSCFTNEGTRVVPVTYSWECDPLPPSPPLDPSPDPPSGPSPAKPRKRPPPPIYSAIATSSLSTGAIVGIVAAAVLVVATMAGLFYFFVYPGKYGATFPLKGGESRPRKDWERRLEEDRFRKFRLKEIRQMTDNFSPDNKLGEGGYGQVFSGRLPSGELVAVKRSKVGRRSEDVENREFEDEVERMAELKHEHVVRLRGYCNDVVKSVENQIFVYEFAGGGSLKDKLDKARAGERFSRGERLLVALQAAKGLSYLHDHRYVHTCTVLCLYCPCQVCSHGHCLP